MYYVAIFEWFYFDPRCFYSFHGGILLFDTISLYVEEDIYIMMMEITYQIASSDFVPPPASLFIIDHKICHKEKKIAACVLKCQV